MTRNRRNIVLLTIDSLRADYCGFLGCNMNTTPVLDALADDGLVFEHAYAPGPRTPSSVPELFTGEVFGPVPDVRSWTLHDRKERISHHLSRHQTIADRLGQSGYETIGITANPWTQYLPDTTFKKGFDTFRPLDGTDLEKDGEGTAPRWFRMLDRVVESSGLSERINWRWKKDWFLQWPRIYDIIQSRIQSLGEPYFLWVFVLDPHQPYLSPKEYRVENSTPEMYYSLFGDQFLRNRENGYSDFLSQSLRRAYRDSIRSVDAFTEKLLEDCPGTPVAVVHSDHGEAFEEHGTWGHQQQLYQENVHVPLLISNTSKSGRISEPITLRSLPVLLQSIAENDGEFIPSELTNQFVMSSTEDGSRGALIGKRWKYISNPDGEELYDIDADPHESENVVKKHSKLTQQLQRLLRFRYCQANEIDTMVSASWAVSHV